MKKAFTLIELLVVIAIIAILAALMFPVFAKSTERAKRVHCINNLKQLSIAILTYAEDYDDKYPWAARNDVVIQQHKPSLHDVLGHYVTDERIWQCPSDIGETFPNDIQGFKRRTPPFYTMAQLTSYDYMGLGIPVQQLQNLGLAGVQISSVKQTSLMPISQENRPWHGTYDPNDRHGSLSPALENVLYCDGHVAQRTENQWRGDTYDAVK